MKYKQQLIETKMERIVEISHEIRTNTSANVEELNQEYEDLALDIYLLERSTRDELLYDLY